MTPPKIMDPIQEGNIKNEEMERFCPLSERLIKLTEMISLDKILDQTIIRKYLSYIKKHIHPL